MEGEVKTFTEIDLELTEKYAAIGATLVALKETVDKGFASTNDHLAQLNGKVLKQEKELDSQSRQLNDFQGFKKGVEEGAKDKARAAANYRSTVISIIVPIITLILIYVIQRMFHIQLPQA